MKVLSFLGPTAYKETTYQYQDKSFKTRFFVEALPHFFADIDSVLVFVTPTVERHDNLAALKERLGKLLSPISIPETHTEKSLWEIFDKLTENVEEGEAVLFDITNSYRSLPFLVFLTAAFLRTAKNVKVKGVLYGAFEAKNDKDMSPVFDLTPFVSLLDWLTATNQFLYTGNARYLASQLNKSGQDVLKPLAQTVSDISFGLDLLRPEDVSDASGKLSEIFDAIPENLPKPFSVLTQRIEESYSQFHVAGANNTQEILQSQLNMINWYYQTQHTVQTIALCREWLVSLLCAHYNVDMWDKDEREDIEILLNGGKRGARVSRHLDDWKSDSRRKRMGKLWNSEPYLLANLRNDVLHTGYRKNSGSVEDVREQTKAIVAEINEIAQLWGLTPVSKENI